MVLMTLNTDFGDAYERESDDPTYFYTVLSGRLCDRDQRAAVRDDTLASSIVSRCPSAPLRVEHDLTAELHDPPL